MPAPPAFVLGAAPPPGALAPPGLALAASADAPPKALGASTPNARPPTARTPRANARSRTAAAATDHESLGGACARQCNSWSLLPETAATDLSRYDCANRPAGGKLRQPQRKPRAEGVGASGLEGRSAGGSGRLKPAGATSLGASAWNSEARYWICPRPRPELGLASAVAADARGGAVVVDVQQRSQTAEARRLDVERARGNGSASDVRDASGSGRPR